MKYKILIRYVTGDSFESYDTSDYLEFEWDNLDICKKNLIRIKEHYNYINDINSYDSKIRKSAEKIAKDKDWFVEKDDNSIKLQLDNLDFFQLRAFWYGCFEHLISAEIEEQKSDWKIEV
jgi:hypothetical protein